MKNIRDIFVIAAPSGTGKTTLTRRLVKDIRDLEVSISLTTRPQRPGEINGLHYWFVDREEFQKHIDQNKMLEWAEVYGQLYGTTFEDLERISSQGRRVILEIDIQGWASIKKTLPQAHSIFIMPPSIKSLWSRLAGRGTDSLAVRWRRLKIARDELLAASSFQHFIINDELEKAYEELKIIVKKDKSTSLSHTQGVKHSQNLVAEFNRAEWIDELKKQFD